MKTKLILLLCALMGVLSTVQATIYTTTRVNDSTLSINRTSGINSGLILNDSAQYNTLKLSGVWDSLSVVSLVNSYKYDSTIIHLDMTNMTNKLSRAYNGIPKTITNILQYNTIRNYRYLKTVCLPSTTDTIDSSFGGIWSYITLDTVTVTNQTSVMYVKGLYSIANSFGTRYIYNLAQGFVSDSIVLKVPRPLYKAYKAQSQYATAFKIVPYDVTVASDVQITNSNNSIKVYPTIVTDVVNVTGLESDKNISLVDLSGNTVLKTKAETQLNVSFLSKGMYLLSVDGKVIQKIIKE